MGTTGARRRFSRHDLASAVIERGWDLVTRHGTISSGDRRARRFGRFGEGSAIMFPVTSLYNERYVWVGSGTIIGPDAAIGVGMVPGQAMLAERVIRIGDRCLIGRGSGIVGHLEIEIGDDVFTGHHVYITDQNHAYEDVTVPIGRQSQPEQPVSIGAGSWLGHGVVVLPGARIGRHVAVGAGSVVSGEIPDFCLAAGNPARVVRRYETETGWVRTGDRMDDRGGRSAAGPGRSVTTPT